MENGVGAEAIEREIRFIRERFGFEGAVLRGEDLALVLGYPSADALRKSAERETCPVRVRKGAGKRGIEAHIEEVAEYLASLRAEKRKPQGDEARGFRSSRHDNNKDDNGLCSDGRPSESFLRENSGGEGE